MIQTETALPLHSEPKDGDHFPVNHYEKTVLKYLKSFLIKLYQAEKNNEILEEVIFFNDVTSGNSPGSNK